IGRGQDLELLAELHYPHSLGMLYSAFTYYTGFKVNSGEYKVMGLAPYGEPKYVDPILEKVVLLKEDGSFKLNMDYFNYVHGLTMTNGAFDGLFGGPPRKPESKLTQREMDVAASVQVVTEEIMLRMARHVHRETGMENLCLAGGVALNCGGNGRPPRALGSRSILGDPRSPRMQSVMNLKIKFREGFRPFAPSVLREHLAEYFELDVDSPYMLLVAPVCAKWRIPMTEEQQHLFGIEK